MLKLVVCEKPSVAQSISKVLRATKRGDGFLEGGGYIVSWCVGHLVELAQPESYEERYAKWRKEDLPILPHSWKYQVTAATKKQFSILKKLMLRPDVESLVCATDAGREGELIFRLVYCVKLDLQELKELIRLLRICSNNLNQYAKKANETGSIYLADIQDLQARLDHLWLAAKELLVRLASIA